MDITGNTSSIVWVAKMVSLCWIIPNTYHQRCCYLTGIKGRVHNMKYVVR